MAQPIPTHVYPSVLVEKGISSELHPVVQTHAVEPVGPPPPTDLLAIASGVSEEDLSELRLAYALLRCRLDFIAACAWGHGVAGLEMRCPSLTARP